MLCGATPTQACLSKTLARSSLDTSALPFVFSFDPMVILTYAAAVTTSIRLGVAVAVLPVHHPARVAHQVATLDYVSRGRAILGVGLLYDLRLRGTALSWFPFAVGIPLLPVYAWLGATGIALRLLARARSERLVDSLRGALHASGRTAIFTALLSNLVSNVPAVLVFKSFVAHLPDPRHAWLTLAMSSTPSYSDLRSGG